MAAFGDYEYTSLGFLITLLGSFLSSLKGILTHQLQLGKMRLHPLDLILRMSVYSCFQCLVYSSLSGELQKVKWSLLKSGEEGGTGGLILALMLNGCMAFFLNVSSFVANRKTSALSMSVAGMWKYFFF